MLDYIYGLKTYVVVLYYIFISVLIIAIILDNKKPEKAYAYIFLLLLFPVGGVLLYFLFGVHYQKKKLFTRLRNYKNNYLKDIAESKKEDDVLLTAISDNLKIPTLFYNLDHALFTLNNDVRILKNGEEKFPVLIREIEKARKSIYLLYYIIEEDRIGTTIIDLLIKKAREGIDVKVIYDAVGSSISRKTIRRLRENGVAIHAYMPVFFSRFAHKANYRNHRKIVLIDNQTGFLGGINIADRYINPNKDGVYWRDTHMMVKGEAVLDLHYLFISDWFFVCGEKMNPEIDIDISAVKSQIPISILGSDFEATYQNIMEAYFSLINNAKHEICITTPYFIPNDSIFDALKITAKSGVKIKLLLPEKPDMRTAYYASQTYLVQLVKIGVEVYYYTKGVIHAKTMMIDENICTIGTTNIDHRSFSLNSEVNAFFIDKSITHKLKQQFKEDLQDAYLVTLDDLLNWPWYKRVLASFARLVAPIL